MTIKISNMTTLIQVFDMNESLHFYCEILGFEVLASDTGETPQDWCLLSWENAKLMLNTQYEPGQAPPFRDQARSNYHDDTGLFFGCENVEETVDYLKSAGFEVDGPKVTAYGMKQLYLHDPDGYNLCFQSEV